ncbi:MAG: Pvc16 family protein [Paludibacteraceae bacterium]|nr:DUF4255 domain-containing protein [Prevotellaceae bacterium]
MIGRVLLRFTQHLQDYLCHSFPIPEGCAEVGFVGNSSEAKPNKVIVSLLSLERDAMAGSASSSIKKGGSFLCAAPVLGMNMNVILAAVFDEKRYVESLSMLSASLLFLQSHSSFSLDGVTYTIEIVTLSSQELNNVWSALGGQYYPSVVCKIRRLVFDAGTTRIGGQLSNNPEIDM